MPNEKCVGSSFDDFLAEEGLTEVVNRLAAKKLIAIELEKARKKKHISKALMAKRMKTSRSAVDRILDPSYSSVRLDTLQKAAHAVGCNITVAVSPVEIRTGKESVKLSSRSSGTNSAAPRSRANRIRPAL